MKRLSCILLTLIIILSLSSCGSTSSYSSKQYLASDSNKSTEVSMEGAGAPKAENQSSNSALQQRKLVKHSEMELQTKDFDKALNEIISYVEQIGGYIESQQVSGRNLYNTNINERYASINARIPTEKLNQAEEKFSELYNVTNHSSYIDDITDSYFDADARLNSAKLKEQRLLELLEKAQSMEDIIAIESKLSDVRYEIESLTASLSRMDKQVAFSYLNLHLYEVIEYDRTEENFGERLLGTFKRAKSNIISWAGSCFSFIIEDLPIIILNLAVFALIVYALTAILKKSGILDKFRRLFKKEK